MDNLLTKQFSIPKIWMGIIIVFLFLFVFWAFFPPPSHAERKAKIVATRFEVQQIAATLGQQAIETGNLTNINNSFIFQAVFGTNGLHQVYYAERTNSQGQVFDWWRTPYQIQIIARTNFIIRSAGPDKIFGDADDIVFNSASNDFVKP